MLSSHIIMQASWYGALISFVQTSPESPLIFTLLHKIIAAENAESLRSSLAGQLNEEDVKVITIQFYFFSLLISILLNSAT